MTERTCREASDECNHYYARGLCRRHYSRAVRVGTIQTTPRGRGSRTATCAYCGQPFTSVKRSGGPWTRCCSKSCARRLEIREGRHPLQDGKQVGRDPEKLRANGERARRTRRARLAGAEREAYTLAEVAKRDGFRCWLCRRKVNMSLRYPHPRSASIDHVVPLSQGGNDVKANVRLAHLGENIARSNKGGWAQQLLIG